MGPRRTLPLVARYADACNLFDIPDGGTIVSRTLGTMAELCAAIGRPFEQIEKTISGRLAADSTPYGSQRRWNWGLRFSANAFGPSFASSERKTALP